MPALLRGAVALYKAAGVGWSTFLKIKELKERR